jgi:hypothetical protein
VLFIRRIAIALSLVLFTIPAFAAQATNPERGCERTNLNRQKIDRDY